MVTCLAVKWDLGKAALLPCGRGGSNVPFSDGITQEEDGLHDL